MMKNFENIIAEKYDLDFDATRAFTEHLRLVEVDKNSHIIEKGLRWLHCSPIFQRHHL